MKIVIIGNAGSGKSTFAKKLSQKLCLPLYHLDKYFWKPGWQEPNYSEFELIHNDLCDQLKWIIEGMNTRILEYRIKRADIIIFLDFSRYLCLFRVLKRAILGFGNIRDSSAPGCPERIPDLKFLKFIWHFDAKQRARIKDLLEKYNYKSILIVKNKSDLAAILNTF
ncbi:hypothetical protein A3F66_04370 [candidate division TM6 bacterium RIFCSPHIGHO2_12_FULL_32_22]|nr:MAG: hypothetical protein A3F66_04370 [candidate division TM6 bacterium RIFCSPHIGHO2_12_FULL_32_22]